MEKCPSEQNFDSMICIGASIRLDREGEGKLQQSGSHRSSSQKFATAGWRLRRVELTAWSASDSLTLRC